MNPNTWKWILSLALGCAVGLALRRGLVMIFGKSGSALLVSTVTASSDLSGGFCSAVVGWVIEQPTLSPGCPDALMFGVLGILATILPPTRRPPRRRCPQTTLRPVRRRHCCMLRSGSSAR